MVGRIVVMSETTPAPKKRAPRRVDPVVKAAPVEAPAEAPTEQPKAPVKRAEPTPLRSEIYLSLRRTYSDGDHGPAVQAIQERMREKGHWDGPCDGRYGTRMTRAVRSLQQAVGVRVTGEMNPWTWEALNS